jgi:MFS family permease
MSEELPSTTRGLTTVQWLICIMAAIGFMFDTYELLMLPLVLKNAVASLAPAGSDPALYAAPTGGMFKEWARALFFVPAIFGGIFGLLGGYLTDRLGRRRVLTWSILLYAFGAVAAGLSTNLWMLLACRCVVFIGVCVEFVAAVAWLAELFPNPAQREKVLGYTQAFSSFGGILIAFVNEYVAGHALKFPAIHGAHEAWRYTLISGLIPAIPLILIRPFLPESPVWAAKKAAGSLKRPSIAALFSPELRWTTIVTTLAFASTFGFAFGAIQQTPQVMARHVDVTKQAETDVAKAKDAAQKDGRPFEEKQARIARANSIDRQNAHVSKFQEYGGLAGRFVFAAVAILIVSRRNLFRLFQIPAFIFIPLFYWWMSKQVGVAGSYNMVCWGMSIAAFFVIAQMSFWGNYIPLVFPVHLRGTGESCAANIGGRVIGTFAAFLTITLAASDKPDPAKMALMCALVGGAYGLAGFILTFLLPEPKPEAAEAD